MLALNFSGSAASSKIIGNTIVTGTGVQSPTNPYEISGVTDGVPTLVGPLYGDGTYNDEYNPSTGKVLRRWAAAVLDRSWKYNMDPRAQSDNYMTIWVENYGGPEMKYLSATSVYCTHLPTTDGLWTEDKIGIQLASTGRLHFRVPKSIATTIDELLTWFEDQKAAGTPVTVVYPIGEEYEENVSNEYITYFDWSQTNVTYDLATSVGVSSAVKVDKDTVHLYGTPVSQFNVMLSFLNNGKYFVLQQGNTYKFSIALEAQSSESYKKLQSVMIRFFLLDSDGTQGVTLDQPGYIDGDKISFDWKYTADKGSICKSIRLQFTADDYYTDWNLELKKGQVELYDPNKEIVDGIGDKLDEQTEKQKGFFERLGDRIKGFFDDLLEGIKNLFIPSGEYISEFF